MSQSRAELGDPVKSGYHAPVAPAAGEFADTRIALLATRWNVDVVDALVEGAREGLSAWGVTRDRVDLLRVPGCYELPLALEALAHGGRYHGVVALGVVIRGDTPHFDFVAGECSRGLREVSVARRLPLGFGVLTVNTPQQAWERAVAGSANKGYEAAVAMLEMLRLTRACDE
jgi:6,7-dimethyl-8-ribityllumazine synthase